jgi:hypothetical protein
LRQNFIERKMKSQTNRGSEWERTGGRQFRKYKVMLWTLPLISATIYVSSIVVRHFSQDSQQERLEHRWNEELERGIDPHKNNSNGSSIEYIDMDGDGDYDIGRASDGTYSVMPNGTTRKMLEAGR